ncbi:MAG: membrane integrity-associated transporter subunit PqiC [Kiritimatiellae bacterium]|nr:membrane integrity-associated transporter subunit PqiC [Kiritimatiellia bacterium]
MNKTLPTVALLACALAGGCIGRAPHASVKWNVEIPSRSVLAAAKAKYGLVRIAQVAVRAPYDGTRFAVLRADGSIAFDGGNAFAASPAAILRGASEDAVRASGLFTGVVHASSSAAVTHSLEISVTRLALDCREKGAREAVVDVSVTLLGGREVVAATRGTASVPAEADYTAAFSAAFASAISNALSAL